MLSLISCANFAQVEIEAIFHSLPDETFYLGFRQGEKHFQIDTVRTGANSFLQIKKDKNLPVGNYLLYSAEGVLLDFILGEDQKMRFEFVDQDNKHFEVFDNTENEVYFGFQKFIVDKKKEVEKVATNEHNRQIAKQALMQAVDAKQQDLLQKYPDLYFSKMLRAQLPKAMRDTDNEDELYFHYVNDYWNKYDFSTPFYIRTSFFEKDLDFLIDEILYPRPDFHVMRMEALLDSVSNPELKQYLVRYLYNKYSSTKVMGLDSVFVHVAEKYVLQKNVLAVSDEFKENLRKRVELLKPNLIGKPAPNLENLRSYDGEPLNLYDVEGKYTVLVFWNSNCGHCRDELPKLKEVEKKLWQLYQAKIVAFYTQEDVEEWKEFIEDEELFNWVQVYDPANSSNFRNLYNVFKTPVVYILDASKTIVAKNIPIEQIEKFLSGMQPK